MLHSRKWTSTIRITMVTIPLLMNSLATQAMNLETELAPHPRLLLTEERIVELREAADSDPVLREYIQRLLHKADAALSGNPLIYEKPDGFRLLPVSRAARGNITLLGLAWYLTGKDAYADKAISHLMEIITFPDWNPVHFLDTAEMAAAAGIGLDWFYDRLSVDQRADLKNAILTKAILPFFATHTAVRYGFGKPTDHWVDTDSNWNQVCNGGILLGALAITDPEIRTDRELLETILATVRDRLPSALEAYEPDGAYPEGVMYWGYGTFYTALLFDALDTALGEEAGLPLPPGFRNTGEYVLHAHGPAGESLSYADGRRSRKTGIHSTAKLFFARKFGMPALASLHHQQMQFAENRDAITAFDVLWYTPGVPAPEDTKQPPLDRHFPGRTPLSAWRSSWNDPNALYAAMVAGDNPGPHGHLDLGSFELRAGSVAWIIDLGKDNYMLPGYWETAADGRRWTYFRLGTDSHNLPMVNGRQQHTPARADFIKFGSATNPGAIVDLSEAYAPTQLLRGLRLLDDRRSVLIQDELAQADGPVVWGLTTSADATLENANRTIRLSKDGKELLLHCLSPAEARFRVTPAPDQPPPHEPLPDGCKRLEIELPASEAPMTIAVWIHLADEQALEAPSLQPLAAWFE